MGSNSSRYNNYDRSTIVRPRHRPIHSRRQEDQEIINQYHQIISNHQVIDAIKKSKKQTSNYLKNYHLIKLDQGDILMQNECPICLDNLKIDDEVYLLPCCHYFHSECLKDWVFRENVCPTCRDKIGKHTSEQLDLAIFKRDKKNRKAKRTYLNNLSKDELFSLVLKLDIKIDKNDNNRTIIDKLINQNKYILFKESKLIESEDNYSDESNTEYCSYSTEDKLEINIDSEEDNSKDQSNPSSKSSNKSFDYDNQTIDSSNLRIINREIVLDDEN